MIAQMLRFTVCGNLNTSGDVYQTKNEIPLLWHTKSRQRICEKRPVVPTVLEKFDK